MVPLYDFKNRNLLSTEGSFSFKFTVTHISFISVFLFLVFQTTTLRAQSNCSILFMAKKGSSTKRAYPSRFDTEALDPKTGESILTLDISTEFSKDWIEKIKRVPVTEPTTVLKSHIREEGQTTDPSINHLYLPILKYGLELTHSLRQTLTHPLERENLVLGRIVVVRSDGNMAQLVNYRHIDRIQYLTGLFNLDGKGAQIDIPKDWFQFRQLPTGHISMHDNSKFYSREIQPGEGKIFSSGLRDFILPGRGSYAIPHSAPIGVENGGESRLGFGFFWYLKGMETHLQTVDGSQYITQLVFEKPGLKALDIKMGWENTKTPSEADALRRELFELYGFDLNHLP